MTKDEYKQLYNVIKNLSFKRLSERKLELSTSSRATYLPDSRPNSALSSHSSRSVLSPSQIHFLQQQAHFRADEEEFRARARPLQEDGFILNLYGDILLRLYIVEQTLEEELLESNSRAIRSNIVNILLYLDDTYRFVYQ
jgi:hypothetical protein